MTKRIVAIPASKEEATKLGIWREGLDFIWTNPGEPLVHTVPCGRDARNWAGDCGCGRALTGIDTTKATTVFKLSEVDLPAKNLQESAFAKSWGLSYDEMERGLKQTAKYLHEGGICQFVGNRKIQCTLPGGQKLPVAEIGRIDPKFDFREAVIKRARKESFIGN